jgi:hypothetical protein
LCQRPYLKATELAGSPRAIKLSGTPTTVEVDFEEAEALLEVKAVIEAKVMIKAEARAEATIEA